MRPVWWRAVSDHEQQLGQAGGAGAAGLGDAWCGCEGAWESGVAVVVRLRYLLVVVYVGCMAFFLPFWVVLPEWSLVLCCGSYFDHCYFLNGPAVRNERNTRSNNSRLSCE